MLTGVRVLECGVYVQGPVTAALLADLGADVIKIEHPEKGDGQRATINLFGVPQHLPDRTGRQVSIGFSFSNRNKRGMLLDLKQDEGREVMRRLVESADIFLHNFRGPIVERLGIGYGELSRINERLIYLSSTGYGTRGPMRNAMALDATGLAFSGTMYAAAQDNGETPSDIAGGISDVSTSLMGAFAITAALHQRERTGKGAELEVSQLGTLFFLQGMNVTSALWTGTAFTNFDRTSKSNPLYNYYRCRDARWIMLGEYQPHRHWRDLWEVLGEPAMKDDPRFADFDGIIGHCVELTAALDAAFLKRRRDEWLPLLLARDIFCSPVNTVLEAACHQQTAENGYIVDYPDSELEGKQTVVTPIRSSVGGPQIRRRAPEWGEHTAEILLEFGYSWDQISELQNKGVI